MAQYIEAHVIVKYDTEANWLANPLILLKGQIAFVLDANNKPMNFKLGVGNKTFAQLPYMFESPSFGSINTSTNFATLSAGWYIPTESGTYLNVTVNMSEGVTVLVWDGVSFTKSVFGQEGGFKLVNLTDVEDDTIPQGKVLAGISGNKAKFRDINAGDVFSSWQLGDTYVPSYNFTSNTFTSGNKLTSSNQPNSIPLRDANGRFSINKGVNPNHASVVGQIPFKIFSDESEAEEYFDSPFKEAGQIVYIKSDEKYYTLNNDLESYRPMFSGDGVSSSFIDLSDTPSSYSNQGDKFLKVSVANNGVVFSNLSSTDFNIESILTNRIAVWDGEEWVENGMEVDQNETDSTIVQRSVGGRVKVGEATDNNDAVPLGQLAELIHLTFTIEFNGKTYIVDKAPDNEEEFLEQGDLIYNVWTSNVQLETILMYNSGNPTILSSWVKKGLTIDI